MKERPILFSGPMVRAILDERKTQTRRLVKPQPDDIADPYASQALVEFLRFWQDGKEHHCPYGQPGDRLWVKETFRLSTKNDCACYEPCSCKTGLPIYRANCPDMEEKWKPSIFMPRWASRITLEVVAVRVERLQDISEEDARAEGVLRSECPDWHAVADYRALWESINGPGSWSLNPWVWVIKFKRL